MNNKIVLVGGVVLVLGVLFTTVVVWIFIVGAANEESANLQGTESSLEIPTPSSPPQEKWEVPEVKAEEDTAEAEHEPITLSGSGTQATETFEIEDGLVVARMSHQGSRNFIVHSLDTSEARSPFLIANQVGTLKGSTAFPARAGTKLLNVDADGPWTITLEQPRPQSAPKTREFSGTSISATELFTLPEGLARFEMMHKGERNFIVDLLDSAGNRVDALSNEIGSFDGSQAVQVPKDGIYLLTVNADGPWSIRVQ